MSKCAFSLLIILLSATIGQAQISKGTILLGGNVGGWFIEDEKGTYTPNSKIKAKDLEIYPTIQFALKDNILFGIRLSYNGNSSYNSLASGPSGDKTRLYGGGFTLTKYQTLLKNFYLFLGSAAYYEYSKTVFYDDPGIVHTATHSTPTVSFTPGLAYNLSKRFYVELAMNDLVNIYYDSFNENYSSPSAKSFERYKRLKYSFGLNSFLPFNIGFRYIIKRPAP